ncbi:MAG: erythromycin esterase family protein [Thermoanaerobaculia bacterium]
MRRVLLALSLGLLVLSPASAAPAPAASAPRPFLDLQFNAAECTAGWIPIVRGDFESFMDSSVSRSGGQSAAIRYTAEERWTRARGYGLMNQEFPVADAAGKRFRLSGYIRTEDVRFGSAKLWITAVDSRGNVVASVEDRVAGVYGTAPWTLFQTEIDVPADAREMTFGILHEGSGTAWFDDLSVALDGVAWTQGKQPAVPRVTPAAVSWLRKSAIPFATPEAGNGFDDLQRLKKVIGDARIVSLGEGTHGTREFFQMKHRLLEFLVEEMGFTHFSIEANMPEAYRVNEYVLTGEGDPYELLEGMYFWTWNTQEVLDMILWMREYNASGKGPVQFTGFDMQFAVVAGNNVRTFLRTADSTYLLEAGALLSQAVEADQNRRATSADLAAARSVYEHMKAKRDTYLARFDAARVDWAIQNARVLVQALEQIGGGQTRDESMAENVEWILDHAPAGSKIVLWAHNAHVSKAPGWMGRFLEERYGDDMVVLGFAFGSGRYNAIQIGAGLGAHEAHPPISGSVESYLAAAGIPRFVLDLRRVPNGAPATWLRQSRNFRSIGAVAMRCAFFPAVVAEEYDALIWFDTTHPAVALPFD